MNINWAYSYETIKLMRSTEYLLILEGGKEQISSAVYSNHWTTPQSQVKHLKMS